jgi:hypothetical protein
MKNRTKLILKLVGSVISLFLSWDFAVGGRSMGPGLQFFQNVHPALYFSLVIIPALLLLAFWGARRGILAIAIALPAVVLVAHVACTIEEKMFIEVHKTTGSGPTPRYFDRNSWLAYDTTTKELTGAD